MNTQREDLLKLARWMWNVVHDHPWDPGEFDDCFDRVYAHADDLETLWQLGGATNDYLRRYPGGLAVPVRLPKRLLASDDREARVIGLKLFNRLSDVSTAEITTEILRALNSGDRYEDYGALYELGNLIERCQAAAERLPADVVDQLVSAINAFALHKDENVHRMVRHRVECLRSLCG